MRELIRERVGDEEDCPYLDGELSTLRYRVVENCTAETYSRMLERGWRRFGTLFFRPGCRACHECRPLRVEVGPFCPNRSMRRVWRKNEDLLMVVRPPTSTREHLALYDRYHADMSDRKGWAEKTAEPFDYYLTFVHGHQDFGHEFLFFLGERLVCVTLVDVLPRALSAVYTFYEPSLRQRSLGVYSVLSQIEFARKAGLPHVYLGFWIPGNASMCYKANYQPHQLLSGRPEHSERPDWSASSPPPKHLGSGRRGEALG